MVYNLIKLILKKSNLKLGVSPLLIDIEANNKH